jgi:hypothetical protein
MPPICLMLACFSYVALKFFLALMFFLGRYVVFTNNISPKARSRKALFFDPTPTTVAALLFASQHEVRQIRTGPPGIRRVQMVGRLACLAVVVVRRGRQDIRKSLGCPQAGAALLRFASSA